MASAAIRAEETPPSTLDLLGATRPVWNMARLSSLVVLAACALLARHVSTLLFANAPSTSSRSLRMAQQAVDERDEGLVLIKPEESGKVVKRDKFNNPPRIVMKTNDWDQPEIQLSTGASNQINYITPVVQSDDIKAWLSLNVNFFAIIGLTTVGGLIEIQRFFPDTLYWNFRAVKAVQIMNAPCWASYLQRRDHVLQQCLKVKARSDATYWREGLNGALMTDALTERMEVSAFTPLKREANECWLFHGTSHHAAEGITTDDFDMTRANPAGLFGAGVYFAESVSKADEYVKGKHVDGVELFPLLLCRVCLGYIYYCDQRRPSARELEEHCLLEDWHSVLGDRKKTSNTFREFIIYDNLQAFPAYIIYYSREY
ncbi:Poly [ADP-ribose] polymerase tankyrase-2 (ADP-ribosyltransferase diphtheria toxin-like 6) (ARTD6) (Poly [ADP-ribose] polymerase 5B) (Protein poly-ADP-ribosyltransferase tankyrase-2) (TNKS-2) (TRF1-interacting ankyrin-related ADP-ribose polymerase 2) (Tankyrase II) (Tankyrase-2) (TANK2) (Tankyrase-like protein) (Tankyrase-related protein) [Durusdinium trenchii]|uniref:Poly [ADP-ribose] polymerase n=1 Tax=Durusdinium trenchii TaxID=1381693 RepID=A0ABP0I923_9DINO